MAVAEWNGEIIAESNKFETCEGNVYFPPDSLKKQYFKASDTKSTCPWKGLASYYNIEVNGKTNKVLSLAEPFYESSFYLIIKGNSCLIFTVEFISHELRLNKLKLFRSTPPL
jgi:hypothetical protein